MTDQPVSAPGAAVTEERIAEIRKFVAPLTRDDLPPESWIAWYRDLLAALRQRDEEVARLKGEQVCKDAEAAGFAKWSADSIKALQEECGRYADKLLAAEARLAQANEALTEALGFITRNSGITVSRQNIVRVINAAIGALEAAPVPTQRAQSAGGEVTDAETREWLRMLDDKGTPLDMALEHSTAIQRHDKWILFPSNYANLAAFIRKQASALAEAKKENYALMAAPNPRAFNLSQWADWLRLLREVRGYMHTCWRQHDGGDRKGRDFAEQALKEMEDRISAIVKPQEPSSAG